MTNNVSIFTQQTGAVSERGMTALAQQVVGKTNATGRRIQANINGTFKKIVNGEPVGTAIRGQFNAIVIGMLTDVSRIYYTEKFDPNKEFTMPACWSNIGDKPEAGASKPQHANCAGCPMNIKGSGDNGGKACRYQRRISILLEGDSSGTVYQFNIPAKSLFGKGVGNVHPFESYVKFLVSNGKSPDLVVTNIAFDNEAETMELLFSPVREVNDAEFELVSAAQKRPETVAYTKLTVGQTDGVGKKAAPAKESEPEPEPEAKVTRLDEPDGADDIPAPVKVAKKKEQPPEPVTDASLALILNKWGSDEV